tara:strand:- start:2402 stop:3094 length:693 start_codon:yes stop_codon:yes gene_type:complete
MKLVLLSFISLVRSLSFDPKLYPYDPRIHNFGNVGIGGKFHASLARPITKLIDIAAYNGEDIRKIIVNDLKISQPTSISDWCCGVGMSTDALSQRFDDTVKIYGVDTSPEMLEVARVKSLSNATFIVANAEDVVLPKPVNLISLMFGFHEIPQFGRINILKNMRQNLKSMGAILIVDIDMEYKPSDMMLSGEPYIIDYLKNVQSDIKQVFPKVVEKVIVPGHVRMWYSEL